MTPRIADLLNPRNLTMIAVGFVAMVSGHAMAAEIDAQALFDAEVESVLVNQCLECHGVKREGELDLRTRATALTGSENGVILQPGNADDSKLFELIYDEKMPPKKSLSDEDVETLRQWIEGGLYYPEEPLVGPLPAKDDWWSLQPLEEVALPIGDGLPIDRFIRDTLRAEGLTPSRSANPQTLIRRVTYDLHGLPSTPEEINAFVEACRVETGSSTAISEKAYAYLIDRLLDSPRYGEIGRAHV